MSLPVAVNLNRLATDFLVFCMEISRAAVRPDARDERAPSIVATPSPAPAPMLSHGRFVSLSVSPSRSHFRRGQIRPDEK